MCIIIIVIVALFYHDTKIYISWHHYNTTVGSNGHTTDVKWICCVLVALTELASHPAFRNYNKGDPTSRLYIKNLAKNVTEQVTNTFVCACVWQCVTEPVIVNNWGHLHNPKVPKYFLSIGRSLNPEVSLLSCFILQDLTYIYGRYIDYTLEAHSAMYVMINQPCVTCYSFRQV